jgi:hypothetical protein
MLRRRHRRAKASDERARARPHHRGEPSPAFSARISSTRPKDRPCRLSRMGSTLGCLNGKVLVLTRVRVVEKREIRLIAIEPRAALAGDLTNEP